MPFLCYGCYGKVCFFHLISCVRFAILYCSFPPLFNLWIDQKFSAIPESYTFFSYSTYIYIWLFQSFAYAFITLSLFQGYDYVFSRDKWRTSAFSHVVGKNPGIWVWGDRFVLLVFGMCACVCTKYSTLGGVSTPSSMPAYKPTEDFVSA